MSEMSKYKYEVNFKDIKFTFDLTYDEEGININGKDENNLNEIYEASFTLKYLVEINNIFKLFNKTKECYDYLLKLIKNKKFRVEKESNKYLIIFVVKNFISENEEEIKLFLNAKNLDINTIIKNCNQTIKELRNEISSLKDEISNLRNIADEYKSFKNNINSIIDERIKIEKEKGKEKGNKIFYDVNFSSILTSFDEKIYFQNLIECKNLKLLYRLMRDGSEPSDFHRLCDNKGPTLTIFKSDNNRKFGGYLSKNWESQGEWKKDDNIFLFSVDLRKKYKIKNNISSSYYCLNKIGPCFKSFGYQNYGNLLQKDKCFEHDLTGKYEINEGYIKYEISGTQTQTFLCKDIEVYKIEL